MDGLQIRTQRFLDKAIRAHQRPATILTRWDFLELELTPHLIRQLTQDLPSCQGKYDRTQFFKTLDVLASLERLLASKPRKLRKSSVDILENFLKWLTYWQDKKTRRFAHLDAMPLEDRISLFLSESQATDAELEIAYREFETIKQRILETLSKPL